LRFRKYANSLLFSVLESNSFPVCLAKAAKSFTEPGSVDVTRNISPDCISASAFLARSIGKGQLRPRASSSLLKFISL
jgi:hypothetical protein